MGAFNSVATISQVLRSITLQRDIDNLSARIASLETLELERLYS